MPVVPFPYDKPLKNGEVAKTTFFSSKTCSFFQHDKGCAKLLICIENAKLKKPRTWPPSKIISKEGHVFQNAKFSKIKEIKSLAHQETFFVHSKMRPLSVRFTQFLATNWSFSCHIHSIQGPHIRVTISSQCRDLTIAAKGKKSIKSPPSAKKHFSVVIGVG